MDERAIHSYLHTMPTNGDLLSMFTDDASNAEIARGLMQMFGLDGPDSPVYVDYDRMDELQAEREGRDVEEADR